MNHQAILEMLQAVLDNTQVRVILLLIAADVVAGIGASLATHQFRLWAMARFVQTKLVPYLLGYLSIRLVAMALPEPWDRSADVVWLLIVGSLLGDLVAHLQAAGIQLNDTLAKPDDLVRKAG